MQNNVVLVFDCGATNVRVIAIDINGNIQASHSLPNETAPDAHLQGGKIWDTDQIWQKLCVLCKQVINTLTNHKIIAVTVTSFGVDGTLVNENGEELYPVISWQCERTAPIVTSSQKYINPIHLYNICGVNTYSFNTFYKLIWLKENHQKLLEKAKAFLFMPSLLAHKLCNNFFTDATMAGTSMLTNHKTGNLSPEILSKLNIDIKLFPNLTQAGTIVGRVTSKAFEQTLIPKDTPVISAGHDTQFAIFGSGADIQQPVLSSGTWEILMVRTQSCSTHENEKNLSITNELDAIKGIYNIGQNYLAGNIIEITAKLLYASLKGDVLYKTMINEASLVNPASNNLFINIPINETNPKAIEQIIFSLKDTYSRGEIFRAVLENLSFRLRFALESLEKSGSFKAKSIICVGGGSKNPLWNQIKADVLNIPINLINQKETTVLGASMFAFAAIDQTITSDKLREKQQANYEQVKPSANSEAYQIMYKNYIENINANLLAVKR